jgi:hypothetical protein
MRKFRNTLLISLLAIGGIGLSIAIGNKIPNFEQSRFDKTISEDKISELDYFSRQITPEVYKVVKTEYELSSIPIIVGTVFNEKTHGFDAALTSIQEGYATNTFLSRDNPRSPMTTYIYKSDSFEKQNMQNKTPIAVMNSKFIQDSGEEIFNVTGNAITDSSEIYKSVKDKAIQYSFVDSSSEHLVEIIVGFEDMADGKVDNLITNKIKEYEDIELKNVLVSVVDLDDSEIPKQ